MAGRRPFRHRFAHRDCRADRYFYRLAEYRYFYSDVHQRRRGICPAGVYECAVAGTYHSGDPQLDYAVDRRRRRLYLLWSGTGYLYHPYRQTQRHNRTYLLDFADRHSAVCRRFRRHADDGTLRLHHRVYGRMVWFNQHQLAVWLYRHLAGAGSGLYADGVYDPRRSNQNHSSVAGRSVIHPACQPLADL